MATPQQKRLKDAAEELLAAIRECVPDASHNWTVEEARTATARLAHIAGSIRTNDDKGWEY